MEKVHTVEQTTKPAKQDKSVQPAKSTKPVVPKADKDSLVKAQKADSVKVAPKPQKEASKPDAQKPEVQKPAKEERPRTHRMQRGESLTRVSQKYYGTKDSVRAILRINTFADPNNIPVGAVVKLP